jgi:hypothetical protein
MTRTITTNGTTLLTTGDTTVPTILSGAPNGIIRVFTSGRPEDVDFADVRKVARSAAQRHHGFGSVGSNPVPVPAKYNGIKGLSWDFAPVAKRSTAAPAVAPAAPAAKAAKAREGPDGVVRRPGDRRRVGRAALGDAGGRPGRAPGDRTGCTGRPEDREGQGGQASVVPREA